MARISKMAAAFVGAGLVSMAGNAYVNPSPPSTLPKTNQYLSYSAGSPGVAADAETSMFEEQTSFAGLFAGVMLGMLVGFTGGMSSASAAVESPDTGVVKSIFNESRAPDGHSDWYAAPNDFDKNVSKLLDKKLAYLDIDKNFNPDGIGNNFKVDESQVPAIQYGKLSNVNVKNDPASRIGWKEGELDAKSTPAKSAPVAKVEEVSQKEAPVAAKVEEPVVAQKEDPAAPAEKKGGYSFFKKKATNFRI